MSNGLELHGASAEALMGHVVDDFLERLGRGERPEVEEYARQHPQLATVLRQMLPALQVMHLSAADRAPASEGAGPEIEPEGPLGDFRIVREIGRGGMGVVYEAVQISLGRRVALKVLPFAAALDARQLARFKNEAQAAAHLRHPNIVPVYAVGCERGVHYYAMQLIDGQTLAALVQELRRLAGLEPGDPATPSADTVRQTAGVFSTTHSTRDLGYFRTAAGLAVQAALALEHAHGLGVIHRDIKPANLLVDGEGTLWVTDFGLAQVQTDTRLTLTGDLVGTLRYMSPEQALAQPAGVNHRTDIYSLGATLYELLTLGPAFDGRDRQELLRQIAFEEPRPPRQVNRAIPPELETIVLKAMAKEPGERYATAGDLADDLRRFLEDRPIRARRPSWLEQARKWARRHRPVVWSAAAALLVTVAVLAGSVGWVVRDRAARQARVAADLQAALDDALRFQKDGNWPRAQAAARRAEALLRDGAPEPAVAERVRAVVRELAEKEADDTLLAHLEAIRSLQSEVKEEHFNLVSTPPNYRDAFRGYGWRVGEMAPEEAAAWLRRRPAAVRGPVVAALDHWLILARHLKAPEARWLEQVLSAADSDPWRQAVRAARARGDRQALERLAGEVDAAAQPPEELFLLDQSLRQRGAQEGAVTLLRRAQEAFPGDFWINHDLGKALQQSRPPRYEEAIRFLTAATALRPQSPGAHLNLGLAFLNRGRLDEAIAAFRKAIALKRDYATAHNDLGLALVRKNRQDEAIAAFRQAVRLKPDYAKAHANLGNALLAIGEVDEAVAAYRRATEANPAYAMAHYDLGNALASKGDPEEAAAAYRRAIVRQPDLAEAYCNLGCVLQHQGEFRQALAAFEQGHERGSRRKGWPYPSARWVEESRRLVEREGRLPALLRGEEQPGSAAEQVDYAQLCYGKKHYAAAARLWAAAFASGPKRADDPLTGHRAHAAYAAALAGAGRGVDAGRLDPQERKRWRKQALDWLRADLAALARRLDGGMPGDRPQIAHRLRQWRCDQDLAGLRDPAVVTLLPADEQEACRQFWTEVEALLGRAASAR
jgi:serine/threonine protein kinase/Flp pilus assembly protein TadD